MGDIGDYIYLIILAIAGISSLLKNKKKPKEINPEQSTEYDLEDVLRKLDEAEYENYPSTVPEKEATPAAAEPNTYEKTAEKAYVPQYESVKQYMEKIELDKKKASNTKAEMKVQKNIEKKKTNNTGLKTTEVETSNNIDFSFETIDEAKRAFVYAEIFNRKYK